MAAGKDRPPEYAVKLLEDTCARTGLDWKLRHLYLMQKGTKWMVTLSIDGFRLIGSQDPDYAGQEGPFWVTGDGGTWSDIPPDGPIYAAKVGIKHKSGITTWGVAKFKDYSAGPMWSKFPSTMSAKCAEMLAWRKAFPGKLGGLYGAEEMAQATKERKPKKEEAVEPVESAQDAIDLMSHYKVRIQNSPDMQALKDVGKTMAQDARLAASDALLLDMLYKQKKATL